MMYTMPSDISTYKRTSLDISTDHADQSASHDDHPEQRATRPPHASPIMLSDPLESPSSDAMSFNKDDMYGSDSEVETISLRPFRAEQHMNTNNSMVCP